MFSTRLLFLGLMLLLRSATASAQFGFTHFLSFDIIKQQPLVVLLREEDPKELKKLAGKPEELASYKEYIAYYNKQLQVLAPRHWTYSPSVEFRPESALKELRAAKGQRSVVLRYETHVNAAPATIYNKSPMGSRRVAYMELTTPGGGDQHYEWGCPAPLDILYPSDMVFAFRAIQRLLEKEMTRKTRLDAGRSRKEIEQEEDAEYVAASRANAQAIQTKTLLIAEADLDPKLTAADIKELYPYPFQVVSRATIEAAVQAGDARYNYTRRLCQSVEVIGPVIIDAATSRLLATANTSGVGLGKSEVVDRDAFRIYTTFVQKYTGEK